MWDLKISIVTVYLLSLIIPFLIEPVNGLYNIDELKGLRAYCYLHADRSAQGENVVNDLITTGLANSTYKDWSCLKISETLQAEEKAESERIAAFRERCEYGNLTPTQYWECDHAGYSESGAMCLFEEDREEAQKRISEGGKAPTQQLDYGSELDLSRVQPLTPEEQLVCVNAGRGPKHGR